MEIYTLNNIYNFQIKKSVKNIKIYKYVNLSRLNNSKKKILE